MTERSHLDLGCGDKPRNPYRCGRLCGIDIRPGLVAPGVVEIATANLCQEPIPFADKSFDSVSAYDFIEHVPRVALDYATGATHFPFVQLMNETWRVLKPGGLFYAVTPAYPHALAFCDPTHVNALTDKSHRYFTGSQPMAAMYGFRGRFTLIRQMRVHPRGDYQPKTPGVKLAAKMIVDRVMRRRSHLVWEFQAVPEST